MSGENSLPGLQAAFLPYHCMMERGTSGFSSSYKGTNPIDEGPTPMT